jgi:hypothetical protein
LTAEAEALPNNFRFGLLLHWRVSGGGFRPCMARKGVLNREEDMLKRIVHFVPWAFVVGAFIFLLLQTREF